MLKFSIMVAILLVSVGLYGSNMNLSYAQNQALSQSGNSEAEQEIEQAQSLSQDAQCVSGEITALSCNNLGLQVQRNGDGDNGGNEPPVPPGELGCPRDTVWDVTVREDPETGEEGVPAGTVVCLTEDRPGNQDAYIIENGQPVPTQANPNQPTPNQPQCNGNNQQLAQVTSGEPPQPSGMGEFLCIQVDVPAED